MSLTFDIDKTVAAAAYIAEKQGGRICTIDLLKMLYAAERVALKGWCRPITGDRFSCLPKGIILSRTYSLINQDILSSESDMAKWAEHFSKRSGNDVVLQKKPDYDFLSKRELDALDEAYIEVSELLKEHGRLNIAEVLHQRWPEWKDPEKTCGKKSMPLDVSEILSVLIEDEDKLNKVLLDIQSVHSAKAALQN